MIKHRKIHIYCWTNNKHWSYKDLMGIARRGSALCKVSPNISPKSMSSGFISLGSFQAKWWTREAKIKGTIRVANGNPGHILLQAPKGISSKSWPLNSIACSKNLSGINKFEFGHMLKSRPIAHTFISICAFLGTMKPHISVYHSLTRK